MKSREISRSKIGPFSLACTDPYLGIGWEYQSMTARPNVFLFCYQGRSILESYLNLIPAIIRIRILCILTYWKNEKRN